MVAADGSDVTRKVPYRTRKAMENMFIMSVSNNHSQIDDFFKKIASNILNLNHI